MLKDEFEKMCKNDPEEACLFALSRMLMRHISKTSKTELDTIEPVIREIESENEGINTLKKFLDAIKNYDNELIKYLSECEGNVAKYMRSHYEKSESCNNPTIERQRQNIKSWWK